MCNRAHGHDHNHSHPGHVHDSPHTNFDQRNHVSLATGTRRDFLRVLMGGALAGAGVMELAYHRAAWARAAAIPGEGNLFDLHKAADGVFFAQAHPQAQVNCNAAIFVRSKDVVVVDAHSKPSAAASLIAQIRREVTDKPVRYVINTHFHWDHIQGDHAYRAAGGPLDFVATNTTKQLMADNAQARVKESLDQIPPRIDALRARAAKSTVAAEKAYCEDQIRQLQAYQAELSDFRMELPTITFDTTYLLPDPAFDLHLAFHGHAHTAGDVFVFCPQKDALATGDASHGWLPNVGDGFPRSWPKTIDAVAAHKFKYILGGHGPMRTDRVVMMGQRNFIEELTERVEASKQAGLSLAEMQKRITVASLKSLQANNYGEILAQNLAAGEAHYGPMPPLQENVSAVAADVLANLDKV
jgi:glyoxylase-like metal-dependent hydrolase (beta-lactamase superfamily II)